jgi:anti-anti-sigma factor
MLQSTINSLRNSLQANRQQHTFLILDMRDVTILSSAGWGLFIAEQKKLKDEHRTLFLTDFQPDLQQVFDSLQLHLMIQTFPSVTECLKHIYSEIKQPDRYPIIQDCSNEESPQRDSSDDPMECILNAIAKHGPCSFFKLLSILQTNEHKKLRIGPLKLRSLLKKMELDTFEKRLRYFRSC